MGAPGRFARAPGITALVTRMSVQLIALSEGPSIPLDKPIILIGRHQECDIQIPSRKISRRHCCVAQVGDHLVVRDLGSTNGVRINGIKVVEGNLQPGDELMIGNVRYQLTLPGEKPRPAANGFMTKDPRERAALADADSGEM